MRTLILCVDRDDDLGTKAGVQSPVIGRRRNLEAAMALGLADPEDSDTNAILAAVHVHDRELRDTEGADQVEVATIAGLPTMGVRGDRKLVAELVQVLELVRPDQVVLVSDGAEDERILPILQSHTKVVHVHRSVVKQAPRLEGFYYTLTRILDDPKQSRRFVLPLAILFLFWGAAFMLRFVQYAWGATLVFAGAWLLMHALKWEDSVARVFRDVGTGLRHGRLALIGNILFVVLLAWGAWEVKSSMPPLEGRSLTLHGVSFAHAYLPWVVGGVLVSIGARLLSSLVGDRGFGIGYWMAAFGLIAFMLMVDVLLGSAVVHLEGGSVFDHLREFDTMLQFLTGLGLAVGGMLVSRYFRNFVQAQAFGRDQ